MCHIAWRESIWVYVEVFRRVRIHWAEGVLHTGDAVSKAAEVRNSEIEVQRSVLLAKHAIYKGEIRLKIVGK